MPNRKKYYNRKKPYHPNNARIKKLSPGADTRLKKIFATIGVPAQQEFVPDPFQLEAIAAVRHSDCLVTAPTGSGKTWIAEKAIEHILNKGGKSWYACPLKALSNAKYSEFGTIFGIDRVGILTGDRKEKADADLIVGTTEILRNQLYDAMHHGKSLAVDFVVLDEAHFLGDQDRGVVWEEIMIYLPARIPLLLLSATIGNAHQIADWLASIRKRKCMVIEENRRPVPLFPLLVHPSGTLLPLKSSNNRRGGGKLYKKVTDLIKIKRPPRFNSTRGLPPFDEILQLLRQYHLLPAIFFLKSRADCDNALNLCRGNLLHDENRKSQIIERLDESIRQSPHMSKHRQRWHLENLALGAHHSGQLPSWKLTLEKLMSQGLLDAVFATSTVAAGVNFPARTVAFLNSDRFNGQQFLPLDPTEFHQMTGRAGRRGMDNIGFALVVPGKFMDIRLVADLFEMAPSPVISQIKINFSMVLNLLLSHSPEQIEDMLKKSFATYLLMQHKENANADHRHLWRDFLRHLSFLKDTGFVNASDELTTDGNWASQLRVDQPLLIAEGFRMGIIPDSNPLLLAGVISAFVNERETDDHIDEKYMQRDLLESFRTVAVGLRPFVHNMLKNKFEVRPLYLRPAAAIFAWADGQPWEKVLRIAELEEGNLAMLILRTADNLRHIRGLKDAFPQAAATAAKSIELILREPVVWE